MCFSANSTRWFGQAKKFRLDLKIDIGEMGIGYSEVAKKEHLTDLEVEVGRIIYRMVGLHTSASAFIFVKWLSLNFRRCEDSTIK